MVIGWLKGGTGTQHHHARGAQTSLSSAPMVVGHVEMCAAVLSRH